MTREFLEHQRSLGNDLVTPKLELGFPGLTPGDRWCVLAARWLQSYEAGFAAPVVLSATHERALDVVPLAALRAHAVDVPDDLSRWDSLMRRDERNPPPLAGRWPGRRPCAGAPRPVRRTGCPCPGRLGALGPGRCGRDRPRARRHRRADRGLRPARREQRQLRGRRGPSRRAGAVAACVVRADTRADVNNLVKRRLDVRKASFLGTDDAVERSGMEYGGITPVGLPTEWRVFVDESLTGIPAVILGSGVRRSKLLVPGPLLAELPRAEVVEHLGR